MKNIVLFILLINVFVSAQELQHNAQSLLQNTNYSFFIENKGQWPDEVRYLTKVGGLNAWITDNGVVYDYYKIERNYTQKELIELPRHEKTAFKIEHTEYLNQVVRVNYLNSLSTAGDERLDKKPGHHNYYIGDKSRHAENVELFGEVRVSEIYEGIDIRYYFDEGQLRYDYKAAPNADISQIQMVVEGADAVTVNAEGELVMQTQFGEVVHGKLLAYQNEWYGMKPVECGFTKNTDGTVTVNTAEYDRHKELTIDPLVYSTYLGGSLGDEGIAVGVTSGGDYVVTGNTGSSSTFPRTVGPTFAGGDDLFITQIDAGVSSSTLVYSTFYGDGGDDYAWGLTIFNDGEEKVGIIGQPDTLFALSTDYDFSTSSPLSYSTFVLVISAQDGTKDFDLLVDGNDEDYFSAIGHDNSDQLLILVGVTTSSDLPFSGSYSGNRDGMLFVIPYSSPGDAKGLYYGGTDYDGPYGLAVRELTGNVFISGSTKSTDLPNTMNGVQPSHAPDGESQDWFIAKLDPGDPLVGTPPSVISATYYGGLVSDFCDYIAVEEASGNVYCVGSATSGFPTVNSYQSAPNDTYDGCMAKFSNDLSVCYFATYFGGTGLDVFDCVTVKDDSLPVFTGWVGSTDVPVTAGAEQTSNPGLYTGFAVVFSSDGSKLIYGSYFGGIGFNSIKNVATTPSGNILITGMTVGPAPNDFPITTGNAYQVNSQGDADAFVLEIELTYVSLSAPNSGTESWESGTAKAITWNSNGVSNVKIEYSTNNGGAWSTAVNSLDAAIGSFNWTVPNTPSTQCLVKVSDVSDGTLNDQSDAVFEIFVPTVAVTVPNGGETYRTETTETITWTATGIDNVRIEYSTDNGSNWTLIDPSVAGSLGTFDWTVPNVTSTQCLIRLSDELDPTIVDVSDAIFTIGKPSVTLNYTAGWNILSAPFNLEDPVANNVFPTKISNVFAYSYGYYIIYNILPSMGFWVKFPNPGSSTVDGTGASGNTVEVFTGWNIIGAPEYNVLVADITSTPPGIVISDFYEYAGSYSAVTILEEGRGYWVKCSQPGTLTLPSGGVPKVEPLLTPGEDWITVTVSDAAGNSQQLYVAEESGNFELPPVPPIDIFDARFGDDSYISSETAANQLRFQSEDYPLTITVTNGNLKLTDGATGTIINRQLLDGESLTITNKNIGSLNLNTVEIPADYVLYQNYPNPFNPATTIKFGLPQAGKVEITVYDQLGQKVETLISEELEAGYHELQWNAMQYSSGVYFYTINAGQFKSVKKMLLLK